MLKNGQTYFKNITVWISRNFKSMFDHFSTISMLNRHTFTYIYLFSKIWNEFNGSFDITDFCNRSKSKEGFDLPCKFFILTEFYKTGRCSWNWLM